MKLTRRQTKKKNYFRGNRKMEERDIRTVKKTDRYKADTD
jgi:hypothetical protein